MSGPLESLRVVELAGEWSVFAGKQLADLGADVIIVEPPGGHHTRSYAPYLDGVAGAERSLWWWHYNTSKRGIVIDRTTEHGRAALDRLIESADIVLESEGPATLDAAPFLARHPRLIWTTITPLGPDPAPATDLTVLAAGGPVWSSGYDDHSLPPVRGEGGQARHVAGVFAVAATLIAVLERDVSGRGQHVDVNALAAANVTTEAGSYEWLVARATVQRQSGRHAAVRATRSTQVQGADGVWINTGVAPNTVVGIGALINWLDELGWRERFEEIALLEMAVERGGIHYSEIGQDLLATEMIGASRGAMTMIATSLPAQEFFEGAQRRGIAVGIVASIEEVLANPNLVARGFPTIVHHDDLDRTFVYPGAPYRFTATPWAISRRAPHVGEHNIDIGVDLGVEGV